MTDAPISLWLQQLKGGSDSAAQHLWESCFERLCHLARRRLGNLPRRLKVEEDVALSALDALFQGARQGRFERLEDRDDLWKLLATITARKALEFGHLRGGIGGAAQASTGGVARS